MNKIAVIGAGEMGHGIAEVFGLGGYEVHLVDTEKKYLDRGMERIRESLSRFVRKGDISREGMDEIIGRIVPSTDIGKACKGVDIVIEAVPELPDLKKRVLREASDGAPADAVIGSNTSNIRITDLAESVSNPERVVGIHFFNPAVLMKLVEIVKGEKTDSSTVEKVEKALNALKKTTVIVRRDRPGFIVNRINAAELLFFGLIQDRSIASPEEVDAFVRMQGLPMGPYELIDFVGIDVVKNSLDYFADTLSPEYGRTKIFSKLVSENRLGKKTGRGFHEWNEGKIKQGSGKAASQLSLMDVFALDINESVKMIEEDVASPEEIDTAVRLGMNRPFGPISVAKSLTNTEVREALERLSKQFEMPLFAPTDSIAEGRMREAVEGRLSKRGQEKGKKDDVLPAKTQSGGTLNLEEFGAVARITINRPKYNMISPEVISDLDRTIDELWGRKEIRVVIVTGSGGNFSSGAELSSFIPGASEFIEYARKGERTLRKLSEMPKITIAALKGYVLGGGLELALACDIRVASEDAKLAFPEVTRGLVPAWGGSQMLPKLIGASRAMHFILTAERMTAGEAKEFGLVSKIFKNVDSESLDFARGLAESAAPVAAVLAKRLVSKASEGSSDIGLDMESFAAGILFGTEDLREGIGAFLQKRKAEFKGK